MEQPKSSFTEREQRNGKGRWGKEEEGKRIGKEIKEVHVRLKVELLIHIFHFDLKVHI
jgi:hypothetical protein